MQTRRIPTPMVAGLLACLILFSISISSAAQKQLATGHVPTAVAQGKLAPLGRVPGTNQLRLALDLPVRDAAALTNLLLAIYNPASPEYHHYLTPKEFAARFGPTPEDYAAVIRFAKTNGLIVRATHPNRLVLDVTGGAADVERVFHLRLNLFRHPNEPRNFFAPDREPMVDASLPLFHVSGLDNFSLPHPDVQLQTVRPAAKNSPQGGSGPFGYYIGNDFRQAYVPGTPLTGAGQNVALLEFDGFYPDDVTNYENAIGLTNNPPQAVVVPVDGGVAVPDSGNLEVALDIDMVMAMSPGVSNIYVYEAPNDLTLWVSILSQMADDDLAQQLSSSWSGGAPDPAAEQIFQQMAAQGQSYFNASGDFGAYTGLINFPSESQNVTDVGGTLLTTDNNGDYAGESAWNRDNGVGSGGGIAVVAAIPSWQIGLDMTANGGSTVLRNIPDVAFTADNVWVFYNNGGSGPVGGTSCAAPLWAGFTALVNQQAAQLGQPPVGFLNPTIYSLCRGTNYSAIFHDITNGDNTTSSSPTNYYAVPGYDLCTGWGTPDGTNLINALTTADNLLVVPTAISFTSALIGGPFSPTHWTIMLMNTGVGNLGWSLGGAPAWLVVSPVNGTLAPGEATNVTVQLVNADKLPAAGYIAGVLVTNLTLSRVQIVAAQLDIGLSVVQNGGFETGDFTDWTLVGDTVVGNLIYNAVETDANFPDVAHSGYYGAFLGEGGYLATLTQTLPTISNQLYQFSFQLDNPVSSGSQEFVVSWNGSNLVDLATPPAFGWTNFQFLVTAPGTNTTLQFAARNDANYFGLDDVSVTPVPPIVFGSANFSGNDLQFTWDSLAGLNYEIQFTTNLAPANWQVLGNISATANVCGMADTNIINDGSQRFYRLLLAP